MGPKQELGSYIAAMCSLKGETEPLFLGILHIIRDDLLSV